MKKEGENDEQVFHGLLGGFRRTQFIPELGVFYKNAKVLLKKFENKCIFKSQFQS